MFNYKTADEKAQEWNISLRYIQVLCQQGRIDGAVKKAGCWFIPAEAPYPAKRRQENPNIEEVSANA